MNSDTENLAPFSNRNLLPIRRLSSLIPLRKASRNRNVFRDTNYGISGDYFVDEHDPSVNTFQAYEQEWPPKHLRLRTGDTPTPSKKKGAKEDMFSTPQPVPIRFPISPPPEDEIRRSQSSSGSSRKRARSISKTRARSPNPKARKLPKVQHDNLERSSRFERDFDDWVAPKHSSHRDKSTKSKHAPPHAALPVATKSYENDFDDWIVRKNLSVERLHPKTPSQKPTKRVDGVYTVSKLDKHSSTVLTKHTPAHKARRSSPAPTKSRSATKSNNTKVSSQAKTPKTPSQSKNHSTSKTPRSRASHSRPVTPGRLYAPLPDINSLPPPAPPSPSDDPLLLAGAPSSCRKPKTARGREQRERDERKQETAISEKGRKQKTSLEGTVPAAPAPKEYSPALELSFGDDYSNSVDITFPRPSEVNNNSAEAPTLNNSPTCADTTAEWEPPIPEGTDYLVPLNFGSSVSSSSAKKPSPRVKELSASGSPYPRKYSDDLAGRLVTSQLEDGTPITRKQFFTMRSPSREANLAMRMGVSPKRSEGGQPWLPDASFGLNAQDEVEAGIDSWEQSNDVSTSHVDDLVHTPFTQSNPVQLEKDEQTTSASLIPEKTAYPQGKRLSERFAELEKKLAQEGRSFKISEINALPSSDPVGFAPLGDLPSSSPEKLQPSDSVHQSPEKHTGQPLERAGVDEEEDAMDQEETQLIEQELSTDPAEEEEPEATPTPLMEAPDSVADADNSLILQDGELESVENLPGEQQSRSVEENDMIQAVEPSTVGEGSLPVSVQEEPVSLIEAAGTCPSLQEESFLSREEQEGSFISPIRRDISSVVDASSVRSDIEEGDEAHPKEVGLPTLNSPARPQEPAQSTELEQPAPTTIDQSVLPQDAQKETEGVDEEEEVLEGPSWEDETDAEPLVQIRSNDPDAAARAAAILNLHHEYVQGTPRKRDTSSVAGSSRRRSTSRSSMTPSVVGVRSRYSQLLTTPSRKGGDTSQLVAISSASHRETEGVRPVQEWTKHQWRCLEQCFTDVRLEVARSMGVLDVDPEDIELDDVVDRFVDLFAEGRKLEGEWDWEKIRRRAMALINRQKEGTARGLASVIGSPASSAQTPTRPSTISGPAVRIIPPSTPASTLHAPRYVHLQSEKTAPLSTAFSTPKSNYTSRTYTSSEMPPPPTVPIRSNNTATASSTYPTLPPKPSKPYQIPSATPLGPTRKPVPEPTSATRRVWNWMGSFLRTTSEAPSEASTYHERIPVLPSITDADREALRHVSPPPPKAKTRIIPPKEQVQLQHVPTPEPVRVPRKLNHKTSTGSVRDMIRSFESLSDTLDSSRDRPFLTKKASNGSLPSKSFDMWKDVSTDLSRDQSMSQEISVGSVRSLTSFEGTGFNRGRWRL